MAVARVRRAHHGSRSLLAEHLMIGIRQNRQNAQRLIHLAHHWYS
jgi:hypothetical protein